MPQTDDLDCFYFQYNKEEMTIAVNAGPSFCSNNFSTTLLSYCYLKAEKTFI